MNQAVLTAIYNQLKAANVTQYVYFLQLPSEELLQQLTVTYELTNTSNEDTFDTKEAQKTYRLRIKINAPTASQITACSSIYKQKMYKLKGTAGIDHVKLIDEEIFVDSELKVHTEYQAYDLIY
jgi:hypothetical protein